MPKSSRTIFAALYHNELEKLWAHRGKSLIIAFLVIVVGGVLLVWHSNQQQQASVKSTIVSEQQQIVQLRRQEARASGPQKQQIAAQIQNTKSLVRQMQAQNGAINVKQQIKQLKVSVSHLPRFQRGQGLELLAQYRAMRAQGIVWYNPGVNNGLKLVGDLFASAALLIFALVAVGVSSDRVSSELESGTWGMLLLHAPRRIPVYLAKLFASITVTWSFMAAAALGYLGLGSALMGVGNASIPIVVGVHLKQGPGNGMPPIIPVQVFHTISQGSYDLVALGLAMVSMAAMIAIFIALSMLTRSTVFSLIVSAVLVISGQLSMVVARTAGWLAVSDPAVHLPLMADWTGNLGLQFDLPALNLPTGLTVVTVWAVAAVLVGLWSARRLDV